MVKDLIKILLDVKISVRLLVGAAAAMILVMWCLLAALLVKLFLLTLEFLAG